MSKYLQPEHLNCVILLTDGLANVGETNPDVIGNAVNGLSKRGVSTTTITMGIGDDFNEDLMQGMALSGDGNYYFIQNPDQLPSIFNAELQGIKVPPMSESAPLVKFRLVYDDNETQSRKISHHQLQLPVVNSVPLHDYPFNEERKAKVAQLMASRAKEEAIASLPSIAHNSVYR